MSRAGGSGQHRLSPRRYDHSVLVVDDRVCLVTEAGTADRLQCASDDGETWEAARLPGFR